MQLASERTTSFAGGLNDSAAPDEYAADQSQVMINVRPSLQGNRAEWMAGQHIMSEGVNWAAPESSACFGAIEYRTAAGVQQIVAAFDDEMWYSTDEGATWTFITGALDLDEEYWSFVIYREGSANVLCCANGGSNAYQWNGTTWATISNIPAGTKYLAVLGDRLIAAGADGVQVEASKVSDIDDGYASGPSGWTVKATTHDGDTEITGLFTLGSVLLVFKRKSVGYIEGFGYQTLQVETGARGLSRSVGCVAHRSIAPAGDHAVMWLSERGFEYYPIGGQIQSVSGNQQRFVNRIPHEVIHDHPGGPSAMWLPAKQEYWCAVPLGVGSGAGIGLSRNTWIYIYRPGSESRQPAAYTYYQTTAAEASFSVGTDGMLDSTVGDLTGDMAYVNGRGMLDLTTLPDPGLWGTSDQQKMLNVHAPVTGPASLFFADIGADTSVPCMGSYANGMTILEREQLHYEGNYVHQSGFASNFHDWQNPGTPAWTIAGAVAVPPVSGQGILGHGVPAIVGQEYEAQFTVAGMTTGSLAVFLGNTGVAVITANGTYLQTLTYLYPSVPDTDAVFFFYNASGTWDGTLDDVTLTGYRDRLGNIGIVRTRPLVFGDEFIQTKAKRVNVLVGQSVAHDMTAYALVDGVRGAPHTMAFTSSATSQMRRARVGGRGRVLQAEVHVAAPCVMDAIGLTAGLGEDEV